MDIRVRKSVARISLLPGEGRRSTVTLYKKKQRKKKKQSRFLRAIERRVRRNRRADLKGAATYLKRHKRSNTKKRDGWLRDLRTNLAKSKAKGNRVRRKRSPLRLLMGT